MLNALKDWNFFLHYNRERQLNHGFIITKALVWVLKDVFCAKQLCSDFPQTIIISVRCNSSLFFLWLVSSTIVSSLLLIPNNVLNVAPDPRDPWWTDQVVHKEEEGRHSLCDYRRDLWKPRGKCQMAENLKALHSLSALTHRHFSRLQTPISLDLSLSLSLSVFPSTPSSLSFPLDFAMFISSFTVVGQNNRSIF